MFFHSVIFCLFVILFLLPPCLLFFSFFYLSHFQRSKFNPIPFRIIQYQNLIKKTKNLQTKLILQPSPTTAKKKKKNFHFSHSFYSFNFIVICSLKYFFQLVCFPWFNFCFVLFCFWISLFPGLSKKKSQKIQWKSISKLLLYSLVIQPNPSAKF